MYKKTTLDNGLRVITAPMPQVESVSVAVFVQAGSRYENKTNNGISHFLEHLVFKGSNKYPSHLKVTRTIEGLGNVTNAGTDTEYTFFWVKGLQDNYKKGLDVLFDVVLNPILKSDDIDRERGVILEEINRYEDFPESKVWDVFVKTVWPDQVLGQRVLGEPEIIKTLKREAFVEYKTSRYISTKMVVVAAGKIEHQEFVEVVESYFSSLESKGGETTDTVAFKQENPQLSICYKKTEQAHLILGVQGLNNSHKDRFALTVLSSIMGSGLSSRLFVKLREEKGLCYYIRSLVDLYKDSGLFAVHAGLNLKNIDYAIEEVLRQLKKLKEVEVSSRELEEAKNKIIGPLLYTLESTDGVVQYLGRQELLDPEVLTFEEVVERVKAVNAADIMRVARLLFINKRLNLSIIGPYKDSERLKKSLSIE